MIVNGSVDSSGSKPFFLSAMVMMMRKSAVSPQRISEKSPAIILRDFIEAALHFDVIS
jgi:hypothetical protein